MENNSQESVNVNVKMDEKDIYQYGKYSFYKRPITILVFAINIIVLLIMLAIIILGNNFDVLPIFFLWVGLLLVIIFFTLPKSLKNSASRSVSSSDFKNEERQYTISNNGVSVVEEEEASITQWENIYRVVETKYNFQIYVDKIQAYLIPKRCFNGETEKINTLKSILRSNLPKDKVNINK